MWRYCGQYSVSCDCHVICLQEEDLKKAILGLLYEAVTSQPALAELFLCVQSSSKDGQVSSEWHH